MDRTLLIEHLEQAARHVAEGEHHIARQRQLIAELAQGGHDTRSAIELLGVLERTQLMHIANRDRLRAELGEAH